MTKKKTQDSSFNLEDQEENLESMSESISENEEKTESPVNLIPIEDESKSPLWRIKYRPRTLEDIKLYYRAVYEQFQGYIEAKNIPHLMLVGPEGSGKMVLAEILARELLGAEFHLNFKALFADDPIGKAERDEAKRESHISTSRIGSGAGSDRRARPFIQMRVKPFVSTQKFGSAPFKILCIKAFHKLDVEQDAFRRIMEQYSSNCRMILITDRISGIIDPIISRCQLVMVPYVPSHFFNKFLKDVCDKESVPINLDVLNSVRLMSKANLGKALDLLQLTSARFNNLSLENISKMKHEIEFLAVRDLFVKTIDGNFLAMRKTLREIFQNNALSKTEIMIELGRIILQLPLERGVRALYLDLIAQIDFESLDSNDDEIQLTKLLTKMALIGKEVSKSAI